MTGTTTGQTALTTSTDSDDTENYLTVGLVAALQALANLFESATGHDHSGSGKGKPITTAGIASGVTLTSPHMTTLVVDSGGLTVTAGNVGIGAAAGTSLGLNIAGSIMTTGTSQAGVQCTAASSSTATAESSAFVAQAATSAAGYTSTIATAFHAQDASKGAGSTITSAYGLLVEAQTKGTTNNYGVYINAPSGGATNNIGLYNNGTTRLASLPARQAGDQYLVVNPVNGDVRISAIGPAS